MTVQCIIHLLVVARKFWTFAHCAIFDVFDVFFNGIFILNSLTRVPHIAMFTKYTLHLTETNVGICDLRHVCGNGYGVWRNNLVHSTLNNQHWNVCGVDSLDTIAMDVLAKCYGGDITRKRKLLDKQKKGKLRMRQFGKVEVPQSAFIEALRIGDE